MKYIKAKTIIAHNKYSDAWFGTKYNMNIYRGCSHGCIYCDSRSACYQIEDFDRIAAKKDALYIIEKELKSKRKRGIVGTGAMSDPYNPFENKYRLTRGALELINRYQFGINITTKSDLITRDIDILKEINIHSPVCIGITITASADALSAKIEPQAPASSKRFAAIDKLADNGIYTGILMMPILPFISDNEENIVSIIKLAAEAGAKFIYPSLGVTLRLGQREYFYKNLDRLYPGLKEKYDRTFGDTYQCTSYNHKKLWESFSKACEEYNIAYRMRDIIKGAENDVHMKQISLF
ncbi:SPL family radical SAM protein [Paramaledivibacter caminithermalis]|uniref:SPL family radical SAM protein n=1 Tax=Paramaledivibacter caminithermalis TaxID=191027 RepID=UPI000A06EEB1|nr:radical SAM protein [Paramaledivibacter caminithermalis]